MWTELQRSSKLGHHFAQNTKQHPTSCRVFFFSGSFRSCFTPVAFDDIPRIRFCCFAPGWAFVPCLRCHRCFTTLPLVDLYRRKCADRIMNFTADKFYRFATVVPPLGISERWVNKKMSAKTKGLTKKNSNFRKDKR